MYKNMSGKGLCQFQDLGYFWKEKEFNWGGV